MSEQEYIDATDLQKIRDAKKILIDITPDNSMVISRIKMSEIIGTITSWEMLLQDKIETE